MGRKRPIEKGQRYRAVGEGFLGRPTPLWTVEDVFTNIDGIEYARLVSSADPTMRKTLSIAILSDRRRFARVEETEAA
ncbi:MAG TPA: hypothetical protein VGD08_25535 [Stellaceae bacterium]|jgi:hypothetical protein